jgi:hypothetical protein
MWQTDGDFNFLFNSEKGTNNVPKAQHIGRKSQARTTGPGSTYISSTVWWWTEKTTRIPDLNVDAHEVPVSQSAPPSEDMI